MTVSKLIKTPKIFEYLDQEVSDALHRHGVRNMFDYAWMDEHSPADGFVGLAMWSSEHRSPLLYGFQTPSGYSREEYERLITIAEDLESLMQLARMAIGHTLWMSDLIKSQSIFFIHDHYFWMNHINGVTLLGMASDRIRDLFLWIYFRNIFDEYKKANKKKLIYPGELNSGQFHYPFADALSAPRLIQITANLEELFELSLKIYPRRRSRNETVHDLATKAAKVLKQSLAADPPIRLNGESKSLESMASDSKKAHEANLAGLDDAIKFLTSWYFDLIKATSIIFEIEYALAKS